MGKPQLSDERIGAAPPVPQSRLKKFFSKSPGDMLASLRWNLRNLTHELVSRLRFNLVTWAPKGSWPAFHAYYPDGLRSFPT